MVTTTATRVTFVANCDRRTSWKTTNCDQDPKWQPQLKVCFVATVAVAVAAVFSSLSTRLSECICVFSRLNCIFIPRTVFFSFFSLSSLFIQSDRPQNEQNNELHHYHHIYLCSRAHTRQWYNCVSLFLLLTEKLQFGLFSKCIFAFHYRWAPNAVQQFEWHFMSREQSIGWVSDNSYWCLCIEVECFAISFAPWQDDFCSQLLSLYCYSHRTVMRFATI